ncbi:hypothetical protein KSP39_PZI003076 [Platanthera zijinensis]|uniref:Uncharacterized protein n=1 Tax=Platanthera zijinensis TaxID=2320716 RepID=A0AAP0BUY3_9ASPA
MNSRMRTGAHAMKAAPKHDKGMGKEKEVEEGSKVKELGNFMSRRERKIALQNDVDKLRKKLSWEENVHKALKRAFTRPLGVLPRLPTYLPSYTLELLAEVAVLEEEVVRLEEQVVNFKQAIYKAQSTQWSLDRNRHFPSNRFSGGKHLPKKHNSSSAEEHGGKENQSNSNSVKNTKQSPVKKAQNSNMPKKHVIDRERVEEPNKLSEEILRCLLSIFSRISSPKNAAMEVVESGISPSVSGSSDGFEIEEPLDPYDICSEFGRRDIGPYKHLHELEARSVDRNLCANSLFLIQRLKSLLKKLESVDISELSHHQKLAFWINIYNSCMMNAFLENCMPTTPEMVVEQMLKAKVNVGGQLVSAITIEHFMLRLPYYSKHMSLEGLRSEEKTTRTMFKLDWPEPLVTFALSCGTWSSPPLRAYTASQVRRQLEEAKSDYLRAAVGVSKPNRLGIPKLLDWYMLDFAKNI